MKTFYRLVGVAYFVEAILAFFLIEMWWGHYDVIPYWQWGMLSGPFLLALAGLYYLEKDDERKVRETPADIFNRAIRRGDEVTCKVRIRTTK